MTVRMLSQTEYWAGGATSAGGLFAPALILHSTDGGATHTQEGTGIKGQMLTSMDFIDANHGYATSITGMQICDLLEFGGSNPPAPQHRFQVLHTMRSHHVKTVRLRHLSPTPMALSVLLHVMQVAAAQLMFPMVLQPPHSAP